MIKILTNSLLEQIIIDCSRKHYKEILLITGKGLHSNTDNDVYSSKDLSKLRYSVPEYIRGSSQLSKLVQSIEGGEKKDGGEGSLIIKLKIIK